jgi:plastocyanin
MINNQKVGRWIAPGVIAILTIVVLVIIITRHQTEPTREAVSPSASMTSAEYQTRIASPNKSFLLVFEENKLVTGPSKIQVTVGDSVRVIIQTKTEEVKVTLPGYGISTEATTAEGAEGGFSFVADKPGTFPFYVEAESQMPGFMTDKAPAKTQAGTIEVR